MSYRFADDGSLLWDMAFENTTGRTLEFGEPAFPLRANDDYAAPYAGATTTLANAGGKLLFVNRLLHRGQQYHVENFFGMVRLGCMQILLRHFLQ